ncbi:hypothetical protein HORIV_13670 [Vreelandella olivaria]|uniref:LysR substrate-binding domain-containing protein n=1 Tax=Vreelandella olivaria TaxID=390919 RepID=A0ABM8HN39_9GAMM|nr:hypothetical protein HORIV_13670 [Halomonas olivaria]
MATPRLPGFEASERQIEISLDAEARLTPPLWLPNRARLSLRYGQSPWPGVTSLRLFEDTLFPVCSPSLLAQASIRTPNDLLAQTLLTVDWCSHAGHTPFQAGAIGLKAPNQRHALSSG